MAQDRGIDDYIGIGDPVHTSKGTDIVQYLQSKTVMNMIISEEVKHMREALSFYNVGLDHPKFMDELP